MSKAGKRMWSEKVDSGAEPELGTGTGSQMGEGVLVAGEVPGSIGSA